MDARVLTLIGIILAFLLTMTIDQHRRLSRLQAQYELLEKQQDTIRAFLLQHVEMIVPRGE